YGTETMHVLRAEKGYPIIGQESDGTVTPQDLGMGWIVSKSKRDFVGLRSFSRADTARGDRKQLVGLLPEQRLDAGAQLVPGPRHVELRERGARAAVRAGAARRRARADRRDGACGRRRREGGRLGPLRQGRSAPRWPSCVSSSSNRR